MKLSREDFSKLPSYFRSMVRELYNSQPNNQTLLELFEKIDLEDFTIWNKLRNIPEYTLMLWDSNHGPVLFECAYNFNLDDNFAMISCHDLNCKQFLYDEMGREISFDIEDEIIVGDEIILWPSESNRDWKSWNKPLLVGDSVIINDFSKESDLWIKNLMNPFIGKRCLITKDLGNDWVKLDISSHICWNKSWLTWDKKERGHH